MIDSSARLTQRLGRYRAATRAIDRSARPPTFGLGQERAIRLAIAVDGEVLHSAEGTIVRCEAPSRSMPVDRERLATLPGQPPAHVPLICLDTETTGLATAAGTLAFLVGLGWWEGVRFRQVQLLLPDHADEAALLTALAALIAPDAWLVTYNGRGFDWPLLVARYGLARRAAPQHEGHVDLLPVVRRLFRHRMANARLRTAEADLLGVHRVGDVEGSEIPARYFQFLRDGDPDALVEVMRHNDQDVRSLARLLVHLERRLGDPDRRAGAAPGDLAGLARAFAKDRRLGEALACLDAAIGRANRDPVPQLQTDVPKPAAPDEGPWWSVGRPADFGGRPKGRAVLGGTRRAAFDAPWTTDRIAIDRAHLLRRIGRHRDAAQVWEVLAAGTGRGAILATVELAKLLEHRVRDRNAALAAVVRGVALIERRRRLGRPEPALEADLSRRYVRLQRRRSVATRGHDLRPG